jgi:hypothetical protein
VSGRGATGSPWKQAMVAVRFVAGLPGYLRYRTDVPQAQALIRERMARREADFLAFARAAIYGGHPGNPARRLLQIAGCAYGDLETLVVREGLEGALRTLAAAGVYLSVDELKARRPVVRGSARFEIEPSHLGNPLTRGHLLRHRSGSRGAQAPVPVDLANLRDRAPNLCLSLHARGGLGWRHAYWEVPGGAAMLHLIECHPFADLPARWFSQLDAAAPGLSPRYRWAERVQRWTARSFGARVPAPEHVPLEAPRRILDWMDDVRREGAVPHLKTYASSAVRLCEAALASGRSLQGVHLTVTGEPITAARLRTIRASGAAVVPRCGTSEAGILGSGCLEPAQADELHLFDDLNAMIQPGASLPGLTPRTLLLTSLRSSARMVLLNASVGDEAALGPRRCGCAMERAGWSTHLHSLRSPEKLTSGGITFLDRDVVRVLEEVLPARHGGGPAHYQLVEDETEGGRARLRLLIHPAVGPVDPAAVADTFLEAIGPGSGVERLSSRLWREAGILRAEVRPPLTTAAGKILHLHLAPRGAEQAAP